MTLDTPRVRWPRPLLPRTSFFDEASLQRIFQIADFGGLVSINRPRPEHISASTGADGGAVERLRGLLGGQHRHGSTAEIGERFDWYERGKAPFIALLGHGSPGGFETGDGPRLWSSARQVHFGNRHDWEPHLSRLSRFRGGFSTAERNTFKYSGALLLLSCSVAQGMLGASLMAQLSQVTNRIVFAYTGLVSLTGTRIHLEKGHRWVRQDPGQAPASPPARMRMDEPRPDAVAAQVFPDGMSLADVAGVSVAPGHEGAAAREIAPDDIRWFLPALFHSPPFSDEGEALARATHRVVVRYRSQPPLNVTVFAGALATTDAGACFKTHEAFIDLVADRLPGIA